MKSHSESLNETSPSLIAFRISSLESPSNGGYPTKRIYNNTPQDQTSQLLLYDYFITSGAI